MRRKPMTDEEVARWNKQRAIIQKYTGISGEDMFLSGWETHKKLYNYVVMKENLLEREVLSSSLTKPIKL